MNFNILIDNNQSNIKYPQKSRVNSLNISIKDLNSLIPNLNLFKTFLLRKNILTNNILFVWAFLTHFN